jgi:hypothetical protein
VAPAYDTVLDWQQTAGLLGHPTPQRVMRGLDSAHAT